MAFGISERLAILITADGQGAVRELEKVGRAADRELGKVDDSTARLASQLTRAGAAFLTFGGIAAAGLFKAAGAASDLGEAVNLTERIFGDAADEIGEFARSADAIGQSERQAREATATYGMLLKNMGFAREETVKWSIDLTKLASDMSSAKNVDLDTSINAIGAALRGESEPIRQFGVMLDDASVRAKAVEMGLAATTSQVDRHGKAQATLAIIMEHTADIQGDFVATADGAANASKVLAAQFENMQAKLGKAALPVLERAIGVASALAEGFMAVDDATGGMASNLALIVTGGALAVGALSTLTGWVLKLKENGDALKTTNLGGHLAQWGPTLTAAGILIGGAATAVYLLGKESRDAARLVDDLVGSMDNASDASEGLLRWVNGLVEETDPLANAMDAAGVSTAELAAAMEAGGDELDAMTQRLKEAAEQSGESRMGIMGVELAIDEMAAAVPKATEEWERNNRVLADAAAESDNTGGAFDSLTSKMDEAESQGANLAAQLIRTAQELADEANAAKAAEEALNDYIDAVMSALDSDIAYQRQVLRTTDTIRASAQTLATAERGSRAWEDALLDGKAAALDQAAAAVRLAEDTARANGQTLTASQRQQILVDDLTRVANTLSPGSPLRTQLQGYITNLGRVPPRVQTTMAVDTAAAASGVNGWLQRLTSIPRTIVTTLTTRSTGSPSQPGTGSTLFYPTGGMVAPVGPIVSSDGHRLAGVLPGEIVVNPKRPERGLAAMAAVGMIGTSRGGGLTVNVSVNAGHVANPTQVRDYVIDAVRDAVRLNPGVLTP